MVVVDGSVLATWECCYVYGRVNVVGKWRKKEEESGKAEAETEAGRNQDAGAGEEWLSPVHIHGRAVAWAPPCL